MPRPLFVPDTPSAIYPITGGSQTLTAEEIRIYLGAPSSVDIYQDANVHVQRIRKQMFNDPTPKKDLLQFEFSANQNRFWITAVDDRLDLYVEQVLYQLSPSSVTQKLVLITGPAADAVYIDDNVKNPVIIESGSGNDYLRVGGQHTTVLSGPGSDTIHVTSGVSNIDSGADDDSIQISSPEVARVYAGEGDDRARGGAGLTYIEGGPGNDIIVGGNGAGHNILSGGDDNDTIEAGSSTNVIYPGTGINHISRLKPIDNVYGLPSDILAPITPGERHAWMLRKLSSLAPATIEQLVSVLFPGDVPAINHTTLSPSGGGKTGLVIEGSLAFVSRVEADLSLLRLSPTGRKLLDALDIAAQTGGQAVRINYFEEENARFTSSTQGDSLFIRDGNPGTPAYGGLIEYNPFFSPRDLLPIIGLYHELCHAYNAVTGTAVMGASAETSGSKTTMVQNRELQAVGLPIAIEPFDFDLNPETPPTQTNPEAFTENAIRKELGLPARTSYSATRTDR